MRSIEKDSSVSNENKRSIFLFADSILGLDLSRIIQTRDLNSEQMELLAQREKARKEKNWSESDRLRDLLATTGIAISDGAEGQIWVWI